MKAFALFNPTTLEEARALLAPTRERGRATSGETRLLAGGQDLIGEIRDHLSEPERLVNLKHIQGLDLIEEIEDGGLRIGALATLAEVASSPLVERRSLALREAALAVGSVQIRNAGTVGGNLCQRPRCLYFRNEHTVCLKKGGPECFAFSGENKYNAILGGGPSYIVHPSDLAPALVALEAQASIYGEGGEREVALEDFFTLPSEGSVLKENVLRADEILTSVTIPPLTGTKERGTYIKFRERSSYDFALAAVALVLSFDGEAILQARLCLGGVAPIPWRVPAAEELLLQGLRAGERGDPLWRKVAEAALEGARPLARNGYKVPLAKGLIIRALRTIA